MIIRIATLVLEIPVLVFFLAVLVQSGREAREAAGSDNDEQDQQTN